MVSSILLGIVGPWQGVIIIVALLLLFGGKKIPELMKGLGQGIKEFKNASKTDESEVKKEEPSEKLEEKSQK